MVVWLELGSNADSYLGQILLCLLVEGLTDSTWGVSKREGRKGGFILSLGAGFKKHNMRKGNSRIYDFLCWWMQEGKKRAGKSQGQHLASEAMSYTFRCHIGCVLSSVLATKPSFSAQCLLVLQRVTLASPNGGFVAMRMLGNQQSNIIWTMVLEKLMILWYMKLYYTFTAKQCFVMR